MKELRLTRAAELGLAAVTLAGVVCIGRLLQGTTWVAPLVASALLAHLVVAVLRRRGVHLALAATLTLAAGLLAVTWAGYADTTTLGIPGGETWSAMGDDLAAAWEVFRDESPPAPAEPGFLLVASLAIWFVAFVADWAAFRLWVPFEATLPASTLFLFAAVLGSDRGRGPITALYAAAALAFLLLHRTARREGTSHWVGDRRGPGQRALLGLGGVLVAVAVAAGSLTGPLLPGAEAEAIIETRRSLQEPGSRVTISPLVDIRARLIQQADVEVFRVRSQERAYWRLTSLERFDGRIWSSSGSFGRAGTSLPSAVDTRAPVALVEQVFTVAALAQIWLPAAYEPRSLEAPDAEVRYDDDSSTLIVERERPSSDGLSYRVVSAAPRYSADELRAASGDIPGAIADRYLELPDLPPEVVALAQQITADAATPYDRALALQTHLRAFSYDLNVQPGHGTNALVEFLFETQRGYCEQFAGSFAAMARAIGLPARVAVGFTPGVPDAEDPDVFRVRGEHAHAWPEVYIGGYGWVAFEPTPGRGAPFAESYTGVPEQQAATGDGSTATTLLPSEDAAPGPGGEPIPTTTPATLPDQGTQPGEVPGLSPLPDEVEAPGLVQRWLPGLAVGAGVLLTLVVAYLATVPAVGALRRRRRRRRAGEDATARVRVAWAEGLEHLELVGVVARPSDTHAEVAAAAAATLPGAGTDTARLARAVELADYAPGGADQEGADEADEAAGNLAGQVRAATTTRQRALHAVHPRRLLVLLPRRASRRQVR